MVRASVPAATPLMYMARDAFIEVDPSVNWEEYIVGTSSFWMEGARVEAAECMLLVRSMVFWGKRHTDAGHYKRFRG